MLEPVSNAFSRHFEHEADVNGQEAIHGLVADPRKTAVHGFNALGEAWLRKILIRARLLNFGSTVIRRVKTPGEFCGNSTIRGRMGDGGSFSSSDQWTGNSGQRNWE